MTFMRQRVSRHSYLMSTVSTAFRSGSKLTRREGEYSSLPYPVPALCDASPRAEAFASASACGRGPGTVVERSGGRLTRWSSG